jgi:predicted ester cyclase
MGNNYDSRLQDKRGLAMSEENKNIVRRFYAEAQNQGRVDVLDEIMHPDFRDHGEAILGESRGRDTLQQSITAVRGLLPDLRVEIEDILAEGDMVGVRGLMRCAHLGEWLGAAPTGNEVSWRGLATFRIVDGRITERWFNVDGLSIVQQLGIVTIDQ